MEYRRLGGTGMKVSEVCLGTMTFGREVDEEGSKGLVGQCFEVGGNFIDTADVYGRGDSEEIVGRALKTLGGGREAASRERRPDAGQEEVHKPGTAKLGVTAPPSATGAERCSEAPFRAALGIGLDGRIAAVPGHTTGPTRRDEV